jgi:hypothetical protein
VKLEMVKFGIEFVPREPYWKIIYYAIQAEREALATFG